MIKCGVYHAAIPEAQKERLHEQWREGKVKVVCATIGMLMQNYILGLIVIYGL